MSATTVCLVRHGSVVGAETRRFIGHLDVPLSPLGIAQLEALSRRLRGVAFDAIYCSDLLRTRRWAEILAAPHDLVPIRDAALREFAMGQWDGLTAEQIRALDARAFDAWMADVGRFQFPGGESLPDLVARAVPAFETLVARHAGRTVAVVAHGGSNRAIICHALGLGPERLLALGQDYAALSVLEGGGGRWMLRRLNHCEPLQATHCDGHVQGEAQAGEQPVGPNAP
ncbi:MAG: histidine phosphatase family protein [Candidatus Rokuibacteriota bacterium]